MPTDHRIVANEERRAELLRWMLLHPRLSLTAAEIQRRVAYLYLNKSDRAIRRDLEVMEERRLVERDGKKWKVIECN